MQRPCSRQPERHLFKRATLCCKPNLFWCFFRPVCSNLSCQVMCIHPKQRIRTVIQVEFWSLYEVDMEPHFQNLIACRFGCISSCFPSRCLQMSNCFCWSFSVLVAMTVWVRKSFAESSMEQETLTLAFKAFSPVSRLGQRFFFKPKVKRNM